MLKPMIALVGAALLLGACSSSPPPAPPPPAAQPAQAPSFLVFFDWDRSDLSQQALATIKQAANQFKSGGSPKITAVGHTDTSGPDGYNMALSLRRANAVKRALVAEGVAANQIETVGKGETQPLVATGDGVREPQNRRVEIITGAAPQQSMEIFKDPRSYCKALSDKYRQYTRARGAAERPTEPAALYACEQGNYAEGIPVLEDALIKDNIPLPAPGYRWPGRPIGT